MPAQPEHTQRKSAAAYYNHFFRHNHCRQFTALYYVTLQASREKWHHFDSPVFCPFLWTLLESQRFIFAQYLLNMLKLFLCWGPLFANILCWNFNVLREKNILHTGHRFVPFYIECSVYKWGKMLIALSTDSYSLYCVCVCTCHTYVRVWNHNLVLGGSKVSLQ